MDKFFGEEIAAPFFGSLAVVVQTERDGRFLSVKTVGWAFTREGAMARARRAADVMRERDRESFAKLRKLLDEGRNS